MNFKDILVYLLAVYGLISIIYHWEVFKIFEFHIYGALTVLVTIAVIILAILTLIQRKK